MALSSCILCLALKHEGEWEELTQGSPVWGSDPSHPRGKGRLESEGAIRWLRVCEFQQVIGPVRVEREHRRASGLVECL